MAKQHPWQAFFDGHAPDYMRNAFTRASAQEIAFMQQILNLQPGASILDMGCGTGRHAVGLAQLGYEVTGVDLSQGMLKQAQAAADQAGVRVTLVQADATQYQADQTFDAAICVCEGAFGLLNPAQDPDAHDQQILAGIFASLKPGAPFLLTGLNGWAKLRQFSQEQVDQGRFDPFTLVETFEMVWETTQGKRRVTLQERGYLPGQLKDLFLEAGFQVLAMYGGTAGNWGRRPILLDDIEIMVFARKP